MLKQFRCKKMSDYHVGSRSHLLLSLKSASDVQLTDFRCRSGTSSNFQLNIFTDIVTVEITMPRQNYQKITSNATEFLIIFCLLYINQVLNCKWKYWNVQITHTGWHTCWHTHVDTHMLECHPQHNETIPWDVSWAEREKVKVELMLTSRSWLTVWLFTLHVDYHVECSTCEFTCTVKSHLLWLSCCGQS